MSLRPDQVERYSRHLVLKEIGGPGQQALLSAKILIVGAGGLGCPAALYLAAAGIGHIGLIDDDDIAVSNLQRQILFTTGSAGSAKVDIASTRLKELNPDVKITPVKQRLTRKNAVELFKDYDVILDGCDNFPTRFLVNETAFNNGKILVSGAVGRFTGQVSVHAFNGHKYDHALPASTACYQCLVPTAPPDEESCEQVGIVGALTGIIGSVMALEAIKIITGSGGTLAGKLLIWDGENTAARTLSLPADPACPLCAKAG